MTPSGRVDRHVFLVEERRLVYKEVEVPSGPESLADAAWCVQQRDVPFDARVTEFRERVVESSVVRVATESELERIAGVC